MKTKMVEMSIAEFLNFKQMALRSKQAFNCAITKSCTYNVRASAKFLTFLGF